MIQTDTMNDPKLTASVLIVSYQRPDFLQRCLTALDHQSVEAERIIIVWQSNDVATRDQAQSWQTKWGERLRIVHAPVAGIVAAENAGLKQADTELVLLIDDDAIAPIDWIERHRAHYRNQKVGAVGGGAANHRPDGSRFEQKTPTKVGKITWYGRFYGNMYDHPDSWRARPHILVDHLVGYNFSLRRQAFSSFEAGLRRYWQFFEADACLQVRANGFEVRFDPAIVVDHFPTNTLYDGKRSGDLTVKIANAAYNHALVLAKHSYGPQSLARLLYLVFIGTSATPGLLLWPLTASRIGQPRREILATIHTLRGVYYGWCAGRRLRAKPR